MEAMGQSDYTPSSAFGTRRDGSNKSWASAQENRLVLSFVLT